MTAKKKTSKKKTSKKKDLTLPGTWKEKLAKKARDSRESIALVETNIMRVSGKQFTLGKINYGKKLPAIILNYKFERVYYSGAYNEDVKTSPLCFALSDIDPAKDTDATPAVESSHPQAELCSDCEQDAWGSAQQGEGKACKVRVRLFLGVPDKQAKDVMGLATATLNISTLGYVHFKKYIAKLVDTYSRPVWSVRTLLTFDSEQKQEVVKFELDELFNDAETLDKLEVLVESNKDALGYKYEANKTTDSKASKKKVSKKKASKKKVSKKKYQS